MHVSEDIFQIFGVMFTCKSSYHNYWPYSSHPVHKEMDHKDLVFQYIFGSRIQNHIHNRGHGHILDHIPWLYQASVSTQVGIYNSFK